MGSTKAAADLFDDRWRFVRSMQRCDIEVDADVVTAGARHPPFVAEQRQPFRRRQRGACRPRNRRSRFGRVFREVITAAVRVAEDIHGAGRERCALIATLEQIALLRAWRLETDRNCPERRNRKWRGGPTAHTA